MFVYLLPIQAKGEDKTGDIEKTIRSDENIKKFGDNWWMNFDFRLKNFDRRNGTSYAEIAKPSIITGEQAFLLLRKDGGYPIFGNKKIDALVKKTAKRSDSIALYWELPVNKTNPKALVYLPFFEADHSEFDAVGIGTFLGTTDLKSIQPKKVDTSSLEGIQNYIKKPPKKLPTKYVLILKTLMCKNTETFSLLVNASINEHLSSYNGTPIFLDEVSNYSSFFPKYAPLKGGPIIIFITENGVQDLQYGSSYKYQVSDFFIRNKIINKKQNKSDHWKKIKSNELLLRTISVHHNFSAADFSGMNLDGAVFNGSVISGSNFSKTNLENSSFKGAYIYRSDFSGAKIKKTNFSGSKWINSVCPDGTKSTQNNCGF